MTTKTTSALERLRDIISAQAPSAWGLQTGRSIAVTVSAGDLIDLFAAFEDEQRERERYDEGINRRWLQRDERDVKIRELIHAAKATRCDKYPGLMPGELVHPGQYLVQALALLDGEKR